MLSLSMIWLRKCCELVAKRKKKENTRTSAHMGRGAGVSVISEHGGWMNLVGLSHMSKHPCADIRTGVLFGVLVSWGSE